MSKFSWVLLFLTFIAAPIITSHAQSKVKLDTFRLGGLTPTDVLNKPLVSIDTILWDDSTKTGLLIYSAAEFGERGDMRISQAAGLVAQISFTAALDSVKKAQHLYDSLLHSFTGIGIAVPARGVVELGKKGDTTLVGEEVAWSSPEKFLRLNWSSRSVTVTLAVNPKLLEQYRQPMRDSRKPPELLRKPPELLRKPQELSNEPQQLQPTRSRQNRKKTP